MGELVPVGAHGHAEHVGDRDAVAARLLGEVGIFRELVVEPGFRRRHLAVGQRDAIEHADQALGHGAQIVQHRRAELDLAERHTPVLGLAFSIILEQQPAFARHQQRVEAGHPPIALQVSQARGEITVGRGGLFCP